MQIFPARDVEGMDERAAIIDARLMVMELLFVAGYPAGTTLQDTTADSTCVVIDSGWGILARAKTMVQNFLEALARVFCPCANTQDFRAEASSGRCLSAFHLQPGDNMQI